MITTLMFESEEELKRLLMKVKEESEKAALKFNIQKTKIMASGPISSVQFSCSVVSDSLRPHEPQHCSSHHFTANRCGNNGNSDRLYFLGSKITADGDCSHEIKRHLLLGRKIMTNLDSILKKRDITLLTKVHRVKALVFPVVMYGCKNWTLKKAECQRIDVFELWCWRRRLRVLGLQGKGNQE